VINSKINIAGKICGNGVKSNSIKFLDRTLSYSEKTIFVDRAPQPPLMKRV
jgi:hypothetical protein